MVVSIITNKKNTPGRRHSKGHNEYKYIEPSGFTRKNRDRIGAKIASTATLK